MIKILVIDDDQNIANGISYILRKNIKGIEVISPAFNTKDGYDKVVFLRPEIIITDIRMPGEDGISFIKRVRDSQIDCHFIIISGYSEFEYAKSAIKLGVEDYLTKPIEEEDLVSTVRHVIAKDADASRHKFEVNSVSVSSQELFDIIVKGFIGNGNSPEYVRQLTDELCKSLSADWIMAAEVSVLRDSFKNHSETKNAVENTFRQSLAEFTFECYEAENNDLFYVIGCRPGNEKNLITAFDTAICRLYTKEIDVFIGCSRIHEKAHFEDAYNEASISIGYKIIAGNNKMAFFGQLPEPAISDQGKQKEIVHELERSIDIMDDAMIRKNVEALFREYRKTPISPESLQKLSLNIIFTGLRRTPCLPFDISNYVGKDISSLDNIRRFKDIDQLQNYVVNVLLSAKSCMMNEDFERKHSAIESIKRYIDKNYNNNITLEDISREFYMNPYYCSQLFKKEYGVNYQTYVTNLRVKRAEKLLTETNLQIYKIGELVGYSNINHFNKVFEKVNGIRPVEYRQKFTQ